MHVYFKDNAYLRMINESSLFASEKAIIDKAETKAQFSYGCSNKDRFKHHFKATKQQKNPLIRIVTAISSALVAGVCKTIYHLGCAILVGIPKAVFDEGVFFKKHLFNVLRDLQEAYGHLACVLFFNHGAFHIQESQFQKTCYTFWTFNKAREEREEPSQVIRNENVKKEEKQVTKDDIETFIKSNKIPDALKAIDKSSIDSNEKEGLKLKIAESYLVKGEIEASIKCIEECGLRYTQKDEFYKKHRDALFDKGKVKDSLSLNQKLILNSQDKNAFYKKAAEHYLDLKEADFALKVIKLSSDSSSQNDMYEQLIAYYLELKQPEEACELAACCSYGLVKSFQYEKIAKYYYLNGDLENASQSMDKSSDYSAKEAFFKKMLKEHPEIVTEKPLKCNSKGLKRALALVKDSKVMDEVLERMDKNDYEGAVNLLHKEFEPLVATDLAQKVLDQKTNRELFKIVEKDDVYEGISSKFKSMSKSYSKDNLIEKTIPILIEKKLYVDSVELLNQAFDSEYKERSVLQAALKSLGKNDCFSLHKNRIEIARYFLDHNDHILAAKVLTKVSSTEYEKDKIVGQVIEKFVEAQHHEEAVHLINTKFFSSYDRLTCLQAFCRGLKCLPLYSEQTCTQEIAKYFLAKGNKTLADKVGKVSK